MDRPPERPPGDLTLRQRNKLNIEAEDDNEKPFYGYTQQEIRRLAADERYCDDMRPLPERLWEKIWNKRERKNIKWAIKKEEEPQEKSDDKIELVEQGTQSKVNAHGALGSTETKVKLEQGSRARRASNVFVEIPPAPLYVQRAKMDAKKEDRKPITLEGVKTEKTEDIAKLDNEYQIKDHKTKSRVSTVKEEVDALVIHLDRPDEDEDVDPNMICLSTGSKRPRSRSTTPIRNLRPRRARQDYRKGSMKVHIRAPSPYDRMDISDSDTGILPSASRQNGKHSNSLQRKSSRQTPAKPIDVDELSDDDEHYAKLDQTLKIEGKPITLDRITRSVPPDFKFTKGPGKLTRAERDMTAPRTCWTALYGGSIMKTFPEMTKLHNNPQLQNFMFINRQYSPDAPKRPGGGGLFLDAEDDPNTPDISIEINEKECDWVVVTQNGPNKWRLIGLAAVKGLPCLTAEEWKELGSECRSTWVSHIYTRKWGNRFKARILLRQMEQEEPTRERVKDDLKEKRLPLHTVTKEQIEQAFNVGLIRLRVFGLQCISYPEEIQRQIINEMT